MKYAAEACACCKRIDAMDWYQDPFGVSEVWVWSVKSLISGRYVETVAVLQAPIP